MKRMAAVLDASGVVRAVCRGFNGRAFAGMCRGLLRGQLFSTDFLVSVLVMTVALGLFVHSVDFSQAAYPAAPSDAFSVSSAILAQVHSVALDPARMVQGASACDGKATGFAWCYPLSTADGPVAEAFADSDGDAQGALSLLVQAGVPLGPGHAAAVQVSSAGLGAYSDFRAASGQRYLLFSSSDNAPPASKGPYELHFVTLPPGWDAASRNVCVAVSVSGAQARPLFDNCGRLSGCAAAGSSDRYVECGSSRCVVSVRVCGGDGS